VLVEFVLMLSNQKWLECFFPSIILPCLVLELSHRLLCLAFAISSHLIFYVVSTAKQPFIALEFTNKIEYVHTLKYIIDLFFSKKESVSFISEL